SDSDPGPQQAPQDAKDDSLVLAADIDGSEEKLPWPIAYLIHRAYHKFFTRSSSVKGRARWPMRELIRISSSRVGGTMGAIITCPLEVVKTRLQSSVATFQVHQLQLPPVASTGATGSTTCRTFQRRQFSCAPRLLRPEMYAIAHASGCPHPKPNSIGLFRCLKSVLLDLTLAVSYSVKQFSIVRPETAGDKNQGVSLY
ncbi:unnamed protein product, partial [Darwinula stevensoni]